MRSQKLGLMCFDYVQKAVCAVQSGGEVDCPSRAPENTVNFAKQIQAKMMLNLAIHLKCGTITPSNFTPRREQTFNKEQSHTLFGE